MFFLLINEKRVIEIEKQILYILIIVILVRFEDLILIYFFTFLKGLPNFFVAAVVIIL